MKAETLILKETIKKIKLIVSICHGEDSDTFKSNTLCVRKIKRIADKLDSQLDKYSEPSQ